MSIEKLTKRFQGSIDFAADNKEDLDAASWNYQEGILITVNEAKLLVDLIKKCSIPNAVKSKQMTREEIIKEFEKAGINFECELGDWIDDSFTPVLDLVDALVNKRSGQDVAAQSEQLPCEHEYKAIYLGMGYVKECQKCGDIHQ